MLGAAAARIRAGQTQNARSLPRTAPARAACVTAPSYRGCCRHRDFLGLQGKGSNIPRFLLAAE